MSLTTAADAATEAADKAKAEVAALRKIEADAAQPSRIDTGFHTVAAEMPSVQNLTVFATRAAASNLGQAVCSLTQAEYLTIQTCNIDVHKQRTTGKPSLVARQLQWMLVAAHKVWTTFKLEPSAHSNLLQAFSKFRANSDAIKAAADAAATYWKDSIPHQDAFRTGTPATRANTAQSIAHTGLWLLDASFDAARWDGVSKRSTSLNCSRCCYYDCAEG
jgi:hypothetical protein